MPLSSDNVFLIADASRFRPRCDLGAPCKSTCAKYYVLEMLASDTLPPILFHPDSIFNRNLSYVRRIRSFENFDQATDTLTLVFIDTPCVYAAGQEDRSRWKLESYRSGNYTCLLVIFI